MPREVSTQFIEQAFLQEATELLLATVTISHPDLTNNILLVDNTQSITIGSETFLPVHLDVIFTEEDEESIPVAKLVVDNVGQDLVNVVRELQDPFMVEISIVRGTMSGGFTIERGPLRFHCTGANYTAPTMTLTLGFEYDYLNSKAVKDSFDPAVSPALFR